MNKRVIVSVLTGFTACLLASSLYDVFLYLFDENYAKISTGILFLGIGAGVSVSQRGIRTGRPTSKSPDIEARTFCLISLASLFSLLYTFLAPLGTVISFAGLVAIWILVFFLIGKASALNFYHSGAKKNHILLGLAGGILIFLMVTATLGRVIGAGVNLIFLSAFIFAFIGFFVGTKASYRILAWLSVTIIGAAFFVTGWNGVPFPNWADSTTHQGKQLFQMIDGSSGESMEVESNWSSIGRIDALSIKKQAPALTWFFANATSPSAMISTGKASPKLVTWLRSMFPLPALALEAQSASAILHVGPSLPLTVRLGEKYEAKLIRALNEQYVLSGIFRHWQQENRKGSPNIDVKLWQRNALSVFAELSNSYQHVVIFAPESRLDGWDGISGQEQSLYSVGAIREYWNRLENGGAISILAANDVSLVTNLLNLWEAIQGERGDPESSLKFLRTRTSAYAINPKAPFKGPYRFLISLQKGDDVNSRIMRLDRLAKDSGALPILVPGASSTHLISKILEQKNLDKIRKSFSVVFSKQFRQKTMFSPTSPSDPTVTVTRARLHPYIAWTSFAVIMVWLYALLFVAPAYRKPGTCVAGMFAPVPVYLLQPFMLTAGMIFITVFLMGIGTDVLKIPYAYSRYMTGTLLIGIILGISGIFNLSNSSLFSRFLIVLMLVTIGVLYLLFHLFIDSFAGVSMLVATLVLSISTGFVGLLTGGLFFQSVSDVLKHLPPLFSWMPVMIGIGAFLGIVVVDWQLTGHEKSIALIWSAGLYLVGFILLRWGSQPSAAGSTTPHLKME